jgi:hypothetical protein
VKQTKKYRGACETLTFPHQTQEELYQELNRLGWFWNPKIQRWERDDRIPNAATKTIYIRVMTGKERVEQAAEAIAEALEQYGLELIEKSEPYPCRPPKQNDARVYLQFIDRDDEESEHQ